MPSIKLQKSCPLAPAESFKRISDMLSNDKDLKKLDSAYTCEFNAQQMTGTAKGSMFKANMNVKAASSGSNVEIIIDLPMTLVMFKGMVEKTLGKKLEEALS